VLNQSDSWRNIPITLIVTFLPVLVTCSGKCPQVIFIAELQPFVARLSPLQLRAILAQVHSLTLRRSA
jgi:hypothetical protein